MIPTECVHHYYKRLMSMTKTGAIQSKTRRHKLSTSLEITLCRLGRMNVAIVVVLLLGSRMTTNID